MAVLTVQNVTKGFADTVIIEDVSFEVQKGDRIGLVGVNGSGKTTLFKVLTGEYTPDEGLVVYARDTVPGYMEQHVCKDLHRTAYEEVMTVFAHLTAMEQELEDISAKLRQQLPEEDMHRLILRQTTLNEQFIDFGGLTCRARARSALEGLGLTRAQTDNPVGVLSGGQKAKLQLAKMLLSGANLLLLDEPTNHLDITAVEWLESFLESYSGAFIIVSHDRYFLDKVTTRTFEMEHCHLTAYKGSYTNFVKLKAENQLALQREFDSRQREIKRIEGIIEQQRRWNQARNYVTIASKQKQIDRIAKDMQRPEKAPDAIHFQFHASRRSGDEVLQAEDLGLSFGETKIFCDVHMDIRRGERVFLIGPNGCGKTSLLKILLGKYHATAGWHRFGVGVDTGYYEQSQSGLHDEKLVIDEIWDLHPSMTQTEVRSALAVFLFRGEDVFKQVAALSGGERARILLLKLMLSKTNFLLLDEPTNHLDIHSQEALENTLAQYDGTMLVVSHDRYLINKLADKIYYLDEGGATLYPGNYDAFTAARALENARLTEQNTAAEKTEPESPYKLKKEREASQRRLRAALNQCEREIEENEKILEDLTAQLNHPDNAADYEAALALSAEIAEHNQTAEELLLRWTEISTSMEALQHTLTNA